MNVTEPKSTDAMPIDTAVSAIVLAAGQGTRMRSLLPKPLHKVAGRAMVQLVLDALVDLSPGRVAVVVGHGAEEMVVVLSEDAGGIPVCFAEQREQLGTGDAVRVALASFEAEPDGDVVVVPGDTPLLRRATLTELLKVHRDEGAAATVLTAHVDDPTGYGRIIRSANGQVTGVVEHKDATEAQRAITEFNTAIYCFRRSLLTEALEQIRPNNAQGEWYLTDVVGILDKAGHKVVASVLHDADEAQGVNDRVQLAAAGAVLRYRINTEWMRGGVTMADPQTINIDIGVRLGSDVTIGAGVVLRGDTVIGDGVEIGPHVVIDDSTVGQGATIGASAVIEGANLAPGTLVPPLAHVVGDLPLAHD